MQTLNIIMCNGAPFAIVEGPLERAKMIKEELSENMQGATEPRIISWHIKEVPYFPMKLIAHDDT